MHKDKGRVATPTTSVGLHSRPTQPLLRPGEQPTLGRPEATSTSTLWAASCTCAGRGERGQGSRPCPAQAGRARYGGKVQGCLAMGSPGPRCLWDQPELPCGLTASRSSPLGAAAPHRPRATPRCSALLSVSGLQPLQAEKLQHGAAVQASCCSARF